MWQGAGVCWRVPVIRFSWSLGRVGSAVVVNIETGELNLNDEMILTMTNNAQRLAAGAPL